jgi:hypothetical protein
LFVCIISLCTFVRSTGEWNAGGDNDNQPASYTSSFDALDALLTQLFSSNNNVNNIQQITISGFSSGAQCVSRYSFFTKLPTSILSITRFISGDASSYLYLTTDRPSSSCTVLYDTGVTASCNTFTAPTGKSIV